MKIHKAVSEVVRMVLSAIMESGNDGAPVLAMPGTYHGRPCVVMALHMEKGDSDALMPLAVVLDPESDDSAYLTIDGARARGGEAPSAPQGTPDDAALAVLRDVAAAGGVLAERAQRVLASRPAAPAATIHTGLYL